MNHNPKLLFLPSQLGSMFVSYLQLFAFHN